MDGAWNAGNRDESTPSGRCFPLVPACYRLKLIADTLMQFVQLELEKNRFVNDQSVLAAVPSCRWKSSGRLLHRKRGILLDEKPAGLPRSTVSQSAEGISPSLFHLLLLFFFVSRISSTTIIVVKISEGSRGPGFSSTDSIYIPPGSRSPPTLRLFLSLLLYFSLFSSLQRAPSISPRLSRSLLPPPLSCRRAPFYRGSIPRENR